MELNQTEAIKRRQIVQPNIKYNYFFKLNHSDCYEGVASIEFSVSPKVSYYAQNPDIEYLPDNNKLVEAS